MAFLDAVQFTASAGGTVDFAVGAAVTGYQTPASAGAVNTTTYSYRAQSSNLAEWEIGVGTYSTTGPTLARTTVVANHLGTTAKVSFTNPPNVGVVELTQDLVNASLLTAGTVAQARLGSGSAGAGGKALFDDQTYKTITTPLDFRNILYANGGFEVWQRGAGGSASIAQAASLTAYTADRWFLITGATQASVISQQAGLTNQSRWAARVIRNSAQTGVTVMRFEYPLTTDEVVALRGQNITFQAFFKAGANWSPASGTLAINAFFGTGTEGKRGAVAYTGETNPLTTSVNLTPGGAAAQTTFTGGSTVATNVTQGCLQFSWTPVGTAGAADSIDIDDVQLEAGSIATTFERPTFATTLRECQRHFCKTFSYATAPAQNAGLTNALTSINGGAMATNWNFPVSLRGTPTATVYNPSAANTNWSNTDASATSNIGIDRMTITSTFVTGGQGSIHAQADAGL